MGLIKKLGGYENSKCYLESCGDMDFIGGFTPKQIQEALLEHRREHNIFEVGDDVVAFGDPDFGFYVFEFEDWMHDYIDVHLRHATPEEIKSGCRI